MAKLKSCLDDIRVLDLGRFQAGPRCALMLARLGAEVIKVERPGGEEGRNHPPQIRGDSAYWAQYNAGKKSLTLNLRTEKGKEILRKLVVISDVFLQNFQPGVIAEIGFGYDVIHRLNPRIVMVNVSAYGQESCYRDRPGFDVIGQAISGHMTLTGFEDTPPTVAYSPIIDRITSLHATIACLGALMERQLSGEGQAIDVSLCDTGYTLMEIPICAYVEEGLVTQREGNRKGVAPTNSFKAQDGWVYILAPSEHTFERLCDLIGHPQWAHDPDFTNPSRRLKHRDMIEAETAKWISQHTVAEAVSIMSEAQIPIAPVNDLAAAASEAYLWERELLVKVPAPHAGTILAAGKMVKFSRSETVVGAYPGVGQHNREVLCGLLSYSEAEFCQFQKEGVI